MTMQKVSETEQREQKALAKAVNQIAVLPPQTQEAMTLGRVFALSGFFPDVTSAAQATVKILAGREMGFEPLYSMRNVYIIPGKGSRPPQIYVSTEAYGAKLRSAGVEFEPVEETPDRCEIRFRYRGQEHNVVYTMQQAKRSGVVRDSGAWTERPDWMLYKQCLRNGARQYYAHLIAGMELVADEVQAELDAEAGVQRPMCGIHGVAMRQAKTGHWYCPTLIDGQYCKYQVPKELAEAETVDISDAVVVDGEFENIEVLPEPASPEQIAADMADLGFDSPKPASPPSSGGVPSPPPPSKAQATPAGGFAPAGGQPGEEGELVHVQQRGQGPAASAPTGGHRSAPVDTGSWDAVIAEVNNLLDFHCGPLFAKIAVEHKRTIGSWDDVVRRTKVTPSRVLEMAREYVAAISKASE